MSPSLSIITPSLARDFDACRLLCESMDAYASGFDTHLIVVGGDDLPLFRNLAGPRRQVIDERDVLPATLATIPVRLRGRIYRWAPGIPLIRGWHVQQLIKFGTALKQPNPRVMFIDSDNCFVRHFDLRGYASGARVPLLHEPAAISRETLADHAIWLTNAHELLGLLPPQLPADDFIGNMIVWDVSTVREIVAQIETVEHTAWWKALCRKREFSEYLIYGAGVTSDPQRLARHELITHGPCSSYWSGPALDAAGLDRFIASMRPYQVAIGIQSFIGTPVSLIRQSVLPLREVA